MVRITTPEDRARDFYKRIREQSQRLLEESNPNDRCPNLRVDEYSPYCAKDLRQGEPILRERRLICGVGSLDLFCLDKDRYSICIWYRGEPFQKIRIGVTSENKLKVNAVQQAYSALDLNPEIRGYSTDSGIGEQPVGKITLKGARNRIVDLWRRTGGSLDRIVSIESGIFREDGKWIDRAVVVILDTSTGKESVAYSEGVVFPDAYVERARAIGFDKITVGKVMAEAGFVADSKDPHLSISGKSRQEYVFKTVEKLIKEVETVGN